MEWLSWMWSPAPGAVLDLQPDDDLDNTLLDEKGECEERTGFFTLIRDRDESDELHVASAAASSSSLSLATNLKGSRKRRAKRRAYPLRGDISWTMAHGGVLTRRDMESFFPSNLSYFGATDTMVRLEAMSCSDHEERQAITAHLRREAEEKVHSLRFYGQAAVDAHVRGVYERAERAAEELRAVALIHDDMDKMYYLLSLKQDEARSVEEQKEKESLSLSITPWKEDVRQFKAQIRGLMDIDLVDVDDLSPSQFRAFALDERKSRRRGEVRRRALRTQRARSLLSEEMRKRWAYDSQQPRTEPCPHNTKEDDEETSTGDACGDSNNNTNNSETDDAGGEGDRKLGRREPATRNFRSARFDAVPKCTCRVRFDSDDLYLQMDLTPQKHVCDEFKTKEQLVQESTDDRRPLVELREDVDFGAGEDTEDRIEDEKEGLRAPAYCLCHCHHRAETSFTDDFDKVMGESHRCLEKEVRRSHSWIAHFDGLSRQAAEQAHILLGGEMVTVGRRIYRGDAIKVLYSRKESLSRAESSPVPFFVEPHNSSYHWADVAEHVFDDAVRRDVQNGRRYSGGIICGPSSTPSLKTKLVVASCRTDHTEKGSSGEETDELEYYDCDEWTDDGS